jgi:hypothetical protein
MVVYPVSEKRLSGSWLETLFRNAPWPTVACEKFRRSTPMPVTGSVPVARA